MADLTKAQIEEGITKVILTDAQKGSVNPDSIARQFQDAGVDVEAVRVTKALIGMSTSHKHIAQIDENSQVVLISKETGNIIDLSKNPNEAYQLASERTHPQELKNGGVAKIGSSSAYITVIKAASPQELKQELDPVMEQANRGNHAPLKTFLGDKGEIPQDVAKNFEHPALREAREAAHPDVKCTGSELTPPSAACSPDKLLVKSR
jgi:hypothetical protein